MRVLSGSVVVFCLGLPVFAFAEDDKALTPAEAIKMADKKVTVQMVVRSSKNALAGRQEIYLDSEEDFRDEKNLAVVITAEGAEKFKEVGIDNPAEHFRGKTIRVNGTVTRKDDRPRIEISDPKAIRLIEPKK